MAMLPIHSLWPGNYATLGLTPPPSSTHARTHTHTHTPFPRIEMHACIAAIVNWLSEPVTLAWASLDFT